MATNNYFGFTSAAQQQQYSTAAAAAAAAATYQSTVAAAAQQQPAAAYAAAAQTYAATPRTQFDTYTSATYAAAGYPTAAAATAVPAQRPVTVTQYAAQAKPAYTNPTATVAAASPIVTAQTAAKAAAVTAGTGSSYDAYAYQRTATTYDASKPYYQQAAPMAAYPTTTDASGFPAKTYSSTATYVGAPTSATKATGAQGVGFTTYQNQAAVNRTAAGGATAAYAGFTSAGTTQQTAYTGTTGAQAAKPAPAARPAAQFTSYDAALYNVAASMYAQQQQQQAASYGAAAVAAATKVQGWAPSGFKKQGGFPVGGGGFKGGPKKQPPKPQQLHYCDVCKISCAGPQTYREHLEGQKHKKKEAALKSGQPAAPIPRAGTSLRCELCDVTCTGSDAYAAHIRGAKHQKVVKLHTKLGKPIPSSEPQVVGAPNAVKVGPMKPNGATSDSSSKKIIVAPPKINFVGGAKLSTVGPSMDGGVAALMDEKMEMSMPRLDNQPEIQPVGQDYIEEIKNDEGKVVSFNCKLCECRFNDPNAKEMHMKGRRHRLQYKKKVNPELVVEVKINPRQRKLQEEKMKRINMRQEQWRMRDEARWRDEMNIQPQYRMMEDEERMYWEDRRRYEQEMEYYEWYRRYGRMPPHLAPPPPPRPMPGPPPLAPPQMPMHRPMTTSDDRHVIAKHSHVYPKEDELQAVQKIIGSCEKALKGVSDALAGVAEGKKPEDVKVKEEKGEEGEGEKTEGGPGGKEGQQAPPRVLKGVMRVGLLAKGLLLHGDNIVCLVVLCSEKPTRTLLNKVADLLPKQLQVAGPEEKYEVKRHIQEASVIVTSATEPKVSVVVTLTSPLMREGNVEGGENMSVKDPPDVLDRQKCLDALAALRHAKWFQARASGLQSCVMIIRILRDLCQRVPTWSSLNLWALELLTEKVISSAGMPLGPGLALRRLLEAIASGILLPGGPGILDPCEKEPIDATGGMSSQEREDITVSAQHALRYMAFRQIHKVLGMDPLPAPKFPKRQAPMKRRRDNSFSEGSEEVANGKKDKKDDSDTKMEDVLAK